MENKYNHVTPGKVVRIIVLIALLLFLAAPLLWQISLAFKGPKGRHVRRALPHPR